VRCGSGGGGGEGESSHWGRDVEKAERGEECVGCFSVFRRDGGRKRNANSSV